MGELIGITGAIGSGKTTFAGMMARIEPSHAIYETSQIIIEVGNAFNQALKAELAFETAQSSTGLANQVLIWLPQAISDYVHHDVTWNQLAITKHDTLARPQLYTRLFSYLNAVQATPKLTARTITSKNKADYRDLLQWLGGYLMEKVSKTIWYDELIRRIDLHDADTKLVVVCGVRSLSDAEVIRTNGGRIIAIERPHHVADETDITEKERHAITPDITIVNNSSADALLLVAQRIWHDIGAQKITTHYHAAS